jgi:hypothetical protein
LARSSFASPPVSLLPVSIQAQSGHSWIEQYDVGSLNACTVRRIYVHLTGDARVGAAELPGLSQFALLSALLSAAGYDLPYVHDLGYHQPIELDTIVRDGLWSRCKAEGGYDDPAAPIPERCWLEHHLRAATANLDVLDAYYDYPYAWPVCISCVRAEGYACMQQSVSLVTAGVLIAMTNRGNFVYSCIHICIHMARDGAEASQIAITRNKELD